METIEICGLKVRSPLNMQTEWREDYSRQGAKRISGRDWASREHTPSPMNNVRIAHSLQMSISKAGESPKRQADSRVIGPTDSLASCRAETIFSIFRNISSTPQLARAARVRGGGTAAMPQAGYAFARRYFARNRSPIVLRVTRISRN